MKLLAASAILLLLTSFCPGRPAFRSKLSCTISADKTSYRLGELPVIRVRIVNETGKEQYLLPSLDGSDIRRRMPYCYFEIIKPRPEKFMMERCGNTNPLRAGDFLRVAPGDGFDPYMDNRHAFTDYIMQDRRTWRQTGTYRVQFHYDTTSDEARSFLGDEDSRILPEERAEIKRLIDNMPQVKLVSKDLVLTFE